MVDPIGITSGSDRIAETTLSNGTWISTVELPIEIIDYSCGELVRYETMVFESREELGNELDCRRYKTREQAIEGHAQMVEDWKHMVLCEKKELNKRTELNHKRLIEMEENEDVKKQ